MLLLLQHRWLLLRLVDFDLKCWHRGIEVLQQTELTFSRYHFLGGRPIFFGTSLSMMRDLPPVVSKSHGYPVMATDPQTERLHEMYQRTGLFAHVITAPSRRPGFVEGVPGLSTVISASFLHPAVPHRGLYVSPISSTSVTLLIDPLEVEKIIYCANDAHSDDPPPIGASMYEADSADTEKIRELYTFIEEQELSENSDKVYTDPSPDNSAFALQMAAACNLSADRDQYNYNEVLIRVRSKDAIKGVCRHRFEEMPYLWRSLGLSRRSDKIGQQETAIMEQLDVPSFEYVVDGTSDHDRLRPFFSAPGWFF